MKEPSAFSDQLAEVMNVKVTGKPRAETRKLIADC